MKARYLLIALLLFLCASSLQARDLTGRSQLALHVGMAVPTGEYGEELDPGLDVKLDFRTRVSSIMLDFTAGVARHNTSSDEVKYYNYPLAVHLLFPFAPESATCPYVLIGPAYTRIVCDVEDMENTTTNQIGVDAGGGVMYSPEQFRNLFFDLQLLYAHRFKAHEDEYSGFSFLLGCGLRF